MTLPLSLIQHSRRDIDVLSTQAKGSSAGGTFTLTRCPRELTEDLGGYHQTCLYSTVDASAEAELTELSPDPDEEG